MPADPRKGLPEARCKELLETAEELADVLREKIQESVGQGLSIEAKPDQSLVTSADVEGEQAFRSAVLARNPAHGVRGEEFPPLNPEAEFVWVVDPVDGTAEFAAGLPMWGTIIALYYRDHPLVGIIDLPALKIRASSCYQMGTRINGEPVKIAPMSEEEINGRERVGTPSRVNFARTEGGGALFDKLSGAHPNIRIFHTCYTHVLAASGGLDAALEWNAPLWDVAATRLIIEEAGGKYAELKAPTGADGEPLHNVVFGRPGLVERIAATLAG